MWNLIETRMSWSERNVWFVLVFFYFFKNIYYTVLFIWMKASCIVNFNEINEQFPASIKNLPAFYQQLNFDSVILLRKVKNINIFFFSLQIIVINFNLNWLVFSNWFCYEIPLSIINLIFIAANTNTITTHYKIAINLTQFP